MSIQQVLWSLADWVAQQIDPNDKRSPHAHMPESLIDSLIDIVRHHSYPELYQAITEIHHPSSAALEALAQGSLLAVYNQFNLFSQRRYTHPLDYLGRIDYPMDCLNGNYPSLKYKTSINKSDLIVPWLTYPAIEAILDFDLSAYALVEFGAGLSTLFFSQRSRSVISVESDLKFIEFLQSIPAVYSKSPTFFSSMHDGLLSIERNSHSPQMILVDGDRFSRRPTFDFSVDFIIKSSHPTILIIDDSDIPIYKDGFLRLKEHGIQVSHYYGMKPGQQFRACTSICLSTHSHYYESVCPADHSTLFGVSPFQRDPRWMSSTVEGKAWRGE